MLTYKKEQCNNFDYPNGVVCFLTTIEKMIKTYDIEKKPKSFKLDFKFTVYSYPYCWDLLELIKKTYQYRNIDIRLKKYETSKKNNVECYIYTFEIRNNKLK